jgi:hypothetical protein
MNAQHGQSTVELTALLPLLVLLALGAYAVLAAHTAHEQAGVAAEAGAIAVLQDRDARTAARDALPKAAERHAEIQIEGPRVTVSVRPSVPVLAARITARATADAGPEPTP